MKLVVFGLSVTSSWGNGHATLLRGLFRALARRGHKVVFFEKDLPYYAAHRDPPEVWSCRTILVSGWGETWAAARAELSDADVVMTTSYCPDARLVDEMVFSSPVPLKVFYDLDLPVTLDRAKRGEPSTISARAASPILSVISFTGGEAVVRDACSFLGARRVVPLYGSADPEVHRPEAPIPRYRGLLSYLGTYAADRQPCVETLFFEPARRMSHGSFVLAGPLYPENLRGGANVNYFPHVSPSEHGAFYGSCTMTLNVTRAAMKHYGHCPSGRLFEAAASGAVILSDRFEGLDRFFEPGRRILVATTSEEAMEVIERPSSSLVELRTRARARVIEQHSAEARAREFEAYLDIPSKGATRP